MILSVFGTGHMGQALVRGLLQKNAVMPQQVRLFDADQAKAAEFAASVGACHSLTSRQAVSGADVVLLAVKPQAVATVLQDLPPLDTKQLLVSIAAGVSLSRLRQLAGPAVALARVMPNTPALVGAGVSAVCFSGADQQQQEQAKTLLSACGRVYVVPESAMSAVTGLSGSGPAYIMLVIEALADGGVREGLPRDLALEMAAMTVYGAAGMVLETGRHPAELKDQVCSPGGTTIEAVASLEADGLRSALIRAVASSANKARMMQQTTDSHD